MREEEGQDRAIGHATKGKTTKIDGNHKGRDVCRRTEIYIIERNNAHIIPSIITGNIANHGKSNVTITNEENQQAQESRQKPTRHQRTHATNRTSLDNSNIGVIKKYEARQEIPVADGPQDNSSDDNTYGREQVRGEAHFEETRNNTAWDNQLKGCVTMATWRISGNRKRKTTGKQLITYFRSTLEAPGNPESDTDAHLDKSTIIFTSKKLQDETKEEMGKDDSIMEDHSKHPCKQQRMEQERMKNRIKQTTTPFLTTIIVTLIILNTGSRNTAGRKQGIETPQHGQCAQKQDNRDEKEDSRSMGYERYTTGRTPQTSINNQHKQSKARHELDRTINHNKELITRTDSRPKQHKHYIKGKLMAAIAIVIMIIATAYAAANNIGTTTYKTYNMEQQLSEEYPVHRIKAATTNKPQNTTQEAYTTHAKTGTRTKKHVTKKEQRRICVRALLTENYRQAKEHCREVRQTRKMPTTRQAQGQGRTRETNSRA
jgi:hypothetical protein